jgi:hypothetical protein
MKQAQLNKLLDAKLKTVKIKRDCVLLFNSEDPIPGEALKLLRQRIELTQGFAPIAIVVLGPKDTLKQLERDEMLALVDALHHVQHDEPKEDIVTRREKHPELE